MHDFRKILKDPNEGFSATPVDNDIFRWNAVIFGPPETPLEGGIFPLKIVFPQQYPSQPPFVQFRGPLFHPNVFEDGKICVDILRNKWLPSYDITAVLLSIQSLLVDPDIHRTPEGGANVEAERLFVSDRQAYNRRIQDIVRKQLAEDVIDDF